MEITKGTVKHHNIAGFPVICKTRNMRDCSCQETSIGLVQLEKNGIETRPIICRNMTKQAWNKKYYI